MTKLGNVLIVDDEEIIRSTFSRILEGIDCKVFCAEDGEEALELLKNNHIDLVYLDIHLSNMNGLEVLKAIQDIDIDLSVIIFTGHASLQTSIDALRNGAIDYFIKPLKPDMLIRRTQSLLSDQAFRKRQKEILDQIKILERELKELKDSRNIPDKNIDPTATDQAPSDGRIISVGNLVLDTYIRAVSFNGKSVTLPPTTFDYLVVLAKNSPDLVPYQKLVTDAHGFNVERREAIELNKWHIHVLRDALEPMPKVPKHIINIRGKGYRFVAE